MNEQYKEHLSAFMDGEAEGSAQVVEALKDDDELRSVWQRYHLIRDALHQRLAPATHLDLSAQVSAALANEPTIFAPRRAAVPMRKLVKPAVGMALAASIAVVAVLGVQSYRAPQTPVAQVAEVTPVGKPLNLAVNAPDPGAEKRLDADVESKLSGYLVNHNEYSASAQVQGILPYTRIVSYTPGKRINN